MNSTLLTPQHQAESLDAPSQPAASNAPAIPARRRRRFGPAVRRPRGRDERFRGPQLRPAISPSFGVGSTRVPGDSVHEATALPRGCDTVSAARWRLTDRGIAVVLVAGLMIVVAGLTVVTATALRVTGDSYQVTSQLQR